MSDINFNFKRKYTLEQRKHDAEEILNKYKDRVPVIVEKAPKCDTLIEINKTKFLAPKDMLVAQFIFIIRRLMSLSEESALFLFTENKMVLLTSQTMFDSYLKNKNKDDNFLYLYYAPELIFGNN